MATALDLITGALQEINAIALNESPNSPDAQFALNKLNDMVDEWASRRVYIYDLSVPVFTLVPGLNPHTIGPMGAITSTSLTNNLATYICQNNFANGQQVTVQGCTNGGNVLNVTGNAQGVSGTQFSLPIISANIPSANDSGSVILAGSSFPTFATPAMGQRPQVVEQATLVLTNVAPVVDVPIHIRDSRWWMNVRVKDLQTDIPTDLWYDPDFPNGSIYLWPVPNYSYQIRLKIWGVVPKFPSLSTSFNLPPAYAKALKVSLARDMVGAFQGTWTPQQESMWLRVTKAVQGSNIQSPRGQTGDVGMPGMHPWADYNYFSGLPSNS